MISEQESMMTFDDFEHYWPWLASIKSNHYESEPVLTIIYHYEPGINQYWPVLTRY